MTEIQFLLDLLLNHKLAPVVRAKILARIGEVEQAMHLQPKPAPPRPPPPMAQAPSTLAAMARQEGVPVDLPPPISPIAGPPPGVPPLQRMVGGEVEKNGSRGPRKF